MKRFLLSTMLIIICGAPLFSQHILIEKNDKSSNVIELKTFRRITFNGNDVNILQTNGSNIVTPMEEISRIAFGDYTGIASTIANSEKFITTISADEIAVNCAAGEIINVYNLNGSHLFSARQQADGGSISIAHIAKGIYLIQAAGKTAKFIKR